MPETASALRDGRHERPTRRLHPIVTPHRALEPPDRMRGSHRRWHRGYNEAMPKQDTPARRRRRQPLHRGAAQGLQFGTNGEVDGNYGFEAGNYRQLPRRSSPTDGHDRCSESDVASPAVQVHRRGRDQRLHRRHYFPQVGWVGSRLHAIAPAAAAPPARLPENTSESAARVSCTGST